MIQAVLYRFHNALIGWGVGILCLAAASDAIAAKNNTQADAIDRAAGAVERLESAILKSRTQKSRLAQLLKTLNAELDEMSAQMVRSARTTQAHEATLTKVEARLRELGEAQSEKAIILQQKRKSLAALGGGLQRISRRPPETVLMRPGAPVEAVRTAMLLEFAIPRVNARAEALRREIYEIAALRREIEDQKLTLEETTADLNAERADLAALSAEKQKLYSQLYGKSQEADANAAELAQSAGNLRQLLQGLQAKQGQRNAAAKRLSDLAERPDPSSEQPLLTQPPQPSKRIAALTPSFAPSPPVPAPKLPPISEQKGKLAPPVVGRVALRYGAKITRGRTSKGITLETRPQAQVIAPYDGKVLYAGEFRAYGRIIIIDHGEGYHTLLAGLARIDARPGQNILAGEPVGVMGTKSGGLDRKQKASGKTHGAQRLYVELRHDGAPINPVPWLVANDEKVKG